MNIYKSLSKENYQEYEKDFLSTKAGKLQKFIAEMEVSGEVNNANFSVESLIPVWKYVSSRILKENILEGYDPDKVPLWFYLEENSIHDGSIGYSYGSLDLMDKLAYYLGEVFLKNNDELYWESYYRPKSRAEWQFKPVIKGLSHLEVVYPLSIVFSICVPVWYVKFKDRFNDNNLYDTYCMNLTPYDEWVKTGKAREPN